jgi:hypothetical protein
MLFLIQVAESYHIRLREGAFFHSGAYSYRDTASSHVFSRKSSGAGRVLHTIFRNLAGLRRACERWTRRGHALALERLQTLKYCHVRH